MKAGGYWDENRHWYPDTELLPDDDRALPETVSHDVIEKHRVGCTCAPCSRYPEKILRNLRRRH